MKKSLFIPILLVSFNLFAQTNNFSLEFDGTNDYVESFNGDVINDSTLSMCAWVKQTVSDYDILFYHGAVGGGTNTNNFSFVVAVSFGTVYARFNGTGGSVPMQCLLSFNDSLWHFLSVVFADDTVKFYVDGVFDSAFQYAGKINSGPTYRTIFGKQDTGNNPTQNPSHWNGNLDLISFWDVSLTQNEIIQYMNCPPQGNELGLVGYWNFEEGMGNLTSDQTVNANDATLYNGVLWSSLVPPLNCCLVPNYNPFADTLGLCGDSTVLDAGSGYASYLWSTGDTSRQVSIGASGMYFVEIRDSMGCFGRDTVYLDFFSLEILEGDTTICNGDSVLLSVESSCASNSHSIKFDGDDDEVIFNGTGSLMNFGTGDFSISYWFRSDSMTAGHFGSVPWKIGSTNNYYEVTINSNGSGIPRFHFANGNAQDYYANGNFRIDDGIWHYVTAVREADTISLFLDGLLQNQALLPANANSDNAGNLRITPRSVTTSIYTKTFVDGLEMWGLALSPQEINAYMACPPSGTEAGLLGYWDFEEGTGTSTTDRTANNNTGSLMNGASWSTDVHTPGSSTIAYVWSTADTTQSITVSPTTTTTYWVDGTNGITTCRDSVTVTNASSGDTIVQTGCDSATVNGQAYYTSGTYYQYLTNAAGCDSTLTINLAIAGSSSGVLNQTACESSTINGQTYSNSGTFVQILGNGAGCDSNLTINLVIFQSPVVAFTPLSGPLCTTDSLQDLLGNPSGGVFSGPGVVGNQFDPSASGTGVHTLHYSFTDSNGCSGADSTSIEVQVCVGMENWPISGILVYPNPSDGRFTIEGLQKGYGIEIWNLLGQKIYSGTADGFSHRVSMPLLSLVPGPYVLRVLSLEGQWVRMIVVR